MSANDINKTRPSQHILIFNIAATGILVAIAVIFSLFTFRINNGGVYLVGIPIFLMPVLLRWSFALIGSVVSVVLADLITGYILLTWISIIAYGLATLIISCYKLTTNLWYFFIFLIIATLLLILIYFALEMATLGLSIAIEDLIATAIQMAIVSSATAIFFPATHRIAAIITRNKSESSYF